MVTVTGGKLEVDLRFGWRETGLRPSCGAGRRLPHNNACLRSNSHKMRDIFIFMEKITDHFLGFDIIHLNSRE